MLFAQLWLQVGHCHMTVTYPCNTVETFPKDHSCLLA